MKKFFLLIFLVVSLTNCTHRAFFLPFGVVDDHSAFVPARTAVAPCTVWPNGARYDKLPLTNATKEELKNLCSKFEEFIIDGFKNQPYMRGFSPKAVVSLLEQSGNENLLSQVDELWSHHAGDCSKCENPPSFYVASIVDRNEWRVWLNTFSKATRNADAILMPFVTYAYEMQYLQRGISIKKKAAGVVLLLIDTNNSNLLWSGGRRAEVLNQSLGSSTDVLKALQPPAWETLYERLYVSDLWKQFPGRQTLDQML